MQKFMGPEEMHVPTIMFQNSLQLDEVHSDWKIRNITPVFTNGKRKSQRTIGPSVSPQCKERSWNIFPGKHGKAHVK